MDDAARLKCPSCGHDRITWVAAGRQQLPCPNCGAIVTVEPIEDAPPRNAASAAADNPVRMPGTLDVALPPESQDPRIPAPAYRALPPPPMIPPPYAPPQMAVRFPRPRSMQGVVISLGVLILTMIAAGVFAVMVPESNILPEFTGPQRSSLTSGQQTVAMLIGLASAGAAILYLVLLLVRIHQIHKDVEALSVGAHSPTPGLAMGLLFVPIMHGFWLWHVLRRLSVRVLPPAEGETAVGTVPLTVFLAIRILTLVAMPFQLAFLLHIQQTQGVTEAYLLFAGALAALEVIASTCLALALSSIGNATAAYTAAMLPQWMPAAPAPPYPPQTYGKPV